MPLSAEDSAHLTELTKECIKYQGEYRLSHHGKGSWATTYSEEFIAAAAEIYMIFKRAGYRDPIFWLSNHFIDADILSCRGAMMDSSRTKYLYHAHIKWHIEKPEKI